MVVNNSQELIKAIKKLCWDADEMSQAKLSKAANMCEATVSRYLSGKIEPTLGKIFKLLGALGYTLEIVKK